MDLGPVVAATTPAVQRKIPVYRFGAAKPVGFVCHVLFYLTLPFEMLAPGAYALADDEGARPIDAFMLARDDGWHWTYACWSRVQTEESAVY
jgi:hypothetical protein